MSGVLLIAGQALREGLRRRVFAVVVGLTLLFGVLYAYGVAQLFEDVDSFGAGGKGLDATSLAGATILGLAMFGTLFLGTVLAAFLTIGAVRGDAERGLLQPVVVRPLGRPAYLLGRWLAAAAVSAGYVLVVYLGAVLVTGLIGGWWPDRVVLPGLELALAAAVVAALGVLGSTLLGATANGIAILMTFGAGLLAGLLGQIGDALGSHTLSRIADVASWALPFEALYQDALRQLVADVGGVAGAIVQLGPLGGSRSAGLLLVPYLVVYLLVIGGLAVASFSRRDL